MKLSVPMVAREVGVSPSYLTALFHKNLQISPGEYIRRAKLQESKLMIREGKMNFTEIAQVLQYSTVHHFSRQFKEKIRHYPYGIRPVHSIGSVDGGSDIRRARQTIRCRALDVWMWKKGGF